MTRFHSMFPHSALCIATLAAAALLPWAPVSAAAQDIPAKLILISAPASYLGVNIRDLDDHAARMLGMKKAQGVEVTAVDHDAPAGKAGIHLRDVILAVDGRPVTSAQQFRETMRGYPPQKEVALAVLRDGKPMKFNIRLADRVKLQQQAFARHFNAPMPSIGNSFSSASAMQRFSAANTDEDDSTDLGPDTLQSQPRPRGMFGTGAELDPIGPQLAIFFGVKDGTGLLVKSVEPGSPAATAGLQAGDVICKLNDDAIVSPLDWMRAMQSNQGHPVQLTIVRNKRVETVTLPPALRTQATLVQSPSLEVTSATVDRIANRSGSACFIEPL